MKLAVSELTGTLRSFNARIAELQAKLANVMARFAKNTVNIGVAGKARQGKSTLLQKISGLDNSVIPAADGLPVTGAKSKIIHQEENPHAIIEFFTQDEFLTGIVHSYFAELGLRPAPRNLDDFRKRLPDVDAVLPAKHGVFKKLQELHSTFGQFSSLLSHQSGRTSLDKVHEYVSQENGKVRHHAVKCANIYVRFPNRDVTGVGLIDLPGLGEIAVGHSEKLISSLRQEVDAVILIKLPSEMGTLWDKADYDVFDCIKVAVPEIELQDWLFVLLNENERGNNVKQVELLKKTPPDVGSPLTILSANCRSTEDVDRRVFKLVLDRLATTLPHTDKHYLDSLAQQVLILAGDLEISIKPVKELFDSGPGGEEIRFLNRCGKFLTEVKQSLETLVDNTRPTAKSGRTVIDIVLRRSSKEKNNDFRTAIKKACEAVKQNPPISPVEELKSQFFDKGGWPAVVQQELHHLRSYLTLELGKKLDSLLDQIVRRCFDEHAQRSVGRAAGSFGACGSYRSR